MSSFHVGDVVRATKSSVTTVNNRRVFWPEGRVGDVVSTTDNLTVVFDGRTREFTLQEADEHLEFAYPVSFYYRVDVQVRTVNTLSTTHGLHAKGQVGTIVAVRDDHVYVDYVSLNHVEKYAFCSLRECIEVITVLEGKPGTKSIEDVD